jgi:hypothetical protein
MNSNQATQLALDYRDSEYTGWEWGKTLGGHRTSREFELVGRRYQISLVGFGQPSSPPNPVYQAVPSDPAIAFKRTLERKFGADYSFRYRGGLRGNNQLRVQCYSGFAEPKQSSFGVELYVVYQPDVHAGDPPADAQLKWIQVVRWTGIGSPSRGPYVDTTDCPNPFFISGGLVSVHGTQVFNFQNPVTAQPAQSQHGKPLAAKYLAETFLARDTVTKDAAGKDVIEIYGGLKYGWELTEVTR